MAMKINLMEGRKIGDYRREDDIGSSVYHDNSKKGKMPFYKTIPLAVSAATMILMPAYGLAAEKSQNHQVAQRGAHASVPQKQKKIRILVKDFEITGEGQVEETKDFGGLVRTAYSENEGVVIRDAIIGEFKGNERKGWNKKGLYSLVEDTGLPDSEEADLAIKGTFYRSGGTIYIFAKLINTKTNETIYSYKTQLNDAPNSIPLGGEFVADSMSNQLQ